MTREEMIEDLLVATRRMRDLQCAYFEDRDKAVLIEAKKAERRVDDLLAKIAEIDCRQPRLF